MPPASPTKVNGWLSPPGRVKIFRPATGMMTSPRSGGHAMECSNWPTATCRRVQRLSSHRPERWSRDGPGSRIGSMVKEHPSSKPRAGAGPTVMQQRWGGAWNTCPSPWTAEIARPPNHALRLELGLDRGGRCRRKVLPGRTASIALHQARHASRRSRRSAFRPACPRTYTRLGCRRTKPSTNQR